MLSHVESGFVLYQGAASLTIKAKAASLERHQNFNNVWCHHHQSLSMTIFVVEWMNEVYFLLSCTTFINEKKCQNDKYLNEKWQIFGLHAWWAAHIFWSIYTTFKPIFLKLTVCFDSFFSSKFITRTRYIFIQSNLLINFCFSLI